VPETPKQFLPTKRGKGRFHCDPRCDILSILGGVRTHNLNSKVPANEINILKAQFLRLFVDFRVLDREVSHYKKNRRL
jgi:hypothetical protein